MDIEITKVELVDNRFIHVERIHKDGDQVWSSINRMPKEILAIRAAEYDLETSDPRVLDAVLLEPFFPSMQDGEVHPLYYSETVADALKELERQIAAAKKRHGAPDHKKAKPLLDHAPRDIAWAVKHHRDIERGKHKATKPKASLEGQIKTEAINMLHAEAIEEGTRRG